LQKDYNFEQHERGRREALAGVKKRRGGGREREEDEGALVGITKVKAREEEGALVETTKKEDIP
jgi:hypothetical protein